MKCIKPLAHSPQFEGKVICTHCVREAQKQEESP